MKILVTFGSNFKGAFLLFERYSSCHVARLQLYLLIVLVVKMKLCKVVVAVGCNTYFLPVFPGPAEAFGRKPLSEVGM